MTQFCSAKVTDPGGCELASAHLPRPLGLVCNYYMWVLPNPISVEARIDHGVHSLGGRKGPSGPLGMVCSSCYLEQICLLRSL